MNGLSQAAKRLVDRRPGHRVVSLYLDLDPERLATPSARSSKIWSLSDEATRNVESDQLDHAAGGPPDTIEALNERRVGTLLLEPRFDASGARCPSCGLFVLNGDRRCTVDGTELEPVEHLPEAAPEAAIAQDAEVILINHYPDLGPFHGIGALLRF